jgi:hypothetical protein
MSSSPIKTGFALHPAVAYLESNRQQKVEEVAIIQFVNLAVVDRTISPLTPGRTKRLLWKITMMIVDELSK